MNYKPIGYAAAWILAAVIGISGLSEAKMYKIVAAEWMGYSPVHVAEAKGLWKSQGLDVKVFTVTNPIEITSLFKQGLADIAFEMIGTMVDLYMNEVPLKIITETDWSHGGDKIIIKEGIDARALKGKAVGVYFNAPPVTFFLNRFLSTIDVKLSDIQLLEMEPDAMTKQFVNGVFSAIVSIDPFSIQAEREGKGKVVATTAMYEGCMPEGMMIMEKNLQSFPKEELEKILRGWIKAVQWCQDPANWKDYVKILNENTFKTSGPISEQDLKEMTAAVKIHDVDMLKQRNSDKGGLYQYLEEMKSFLSANQLLKKNFAPEDIFDNRIIKDVLNNL